MKKSYLIASYLLAVLFTFTSCHSSKSVSKTPYPAPSTVDAVPSNSSNSISTFRPGSGNEATPEEKNAHLEKLQNELAELQIKLEQLRQINGKRKSEVKEAAKIQQEIDLIKQEQELAIGGPTSFIAKPKKKEVKAPKKETAKAPAPAKKATSKAKTETASATKPKSTSKPKPKPAPKKETAKKTPTAPTSKDVAPPKPPMPPKPVIRYKKVTEKMVGNYFLEDDPSANEMYCLHSYAPIGKMVYVKNPMNGRSLSLKCIGRLPRLAENSGVDIKITYAAVRRLNLRDKRFQLVCTFDKKVEEELKTSSR